MKLMETSLLNSHPFTNIIGMCWVEQSQSPKQQANGMPLEEVTPKLVLEGPGSAQGQGTGYRNESQKWPYINCDSFSPKCFKEYLFEKLQFEQNCTEF